VPANGFRGVLRSAAPLFEAGAEGVLRLGMILRRGLAEPLHGSPLVLCHAGPVEVAAAHGVLPVRAALDGGPGEPPRGGPLVLRHAGPPEVALADQALRGSEAGLGRVLPRCQPRLRTLGEEPLALPPGLGLAEAGPVVEQRLWQKARHEGDLPAQRAEQVRRLAGPLPVLGLHEVLEPAADGAP